MPTTRRLETPSIDSNGAAVVFEYREGDTAATISTTRGRLVTLAAAELAELGEAVDAARFAIVDVTEEPDVDPALAAAAEHASQL